MATPSTSHQEVHLSQWWLIKTKDLGGKQLAVEGYTYDEKKGTRLFSSATIVKKHDMWTLETADGIIVHVKGAMDESRSNENGIPFEVCDHFLLGFPYYWEEPRFHFEGLISTTEFFQSNNRDMLSNDFEEVSLEKKIGDAPKDSLFQVNAESSDPSVELHTTQDFADEIGTNLSSLSNDKPSEIITAMSLEATNNCLKSLSAKDSYEKETRERRGRKRKMDKHKESMCKFGIRRSSRMTNKETQNRMEVEETKSTLVSHGSDFENEDPVECGSGGVVVEDGPSIGYHERTYCSSDSNLLDNSIKSILRSSKDGIQVGATSLNCNVDVMRDEASEDPSKDLGSDMSNINPSEVNMARATEIHMDSLSREDIVDDSCGHQLPSCSSKKVTAPNKKMSGKEPTTVVKTRRSNRRKVINRGTENRQETEMNKIGPVTPDLTRNSNDKMICESEGKSGREYPTAPHETLHILSSGPNSECSDHGLTRGSSSKSKTRISYVNSTPITKRKLPFLSPDDSGCKKSKSGRLISPPLEYWRNHKFVYNKDGMIAGISRGLPMTEL